MGPSYEGLSAAWGLMTERARAKFCGEGVDEGQRVRDRDTVQMWAKAEGADLETEAERAKAKRRSVNRVA
jgi:hypothetical protein